MVQTNHADSDRQRRLAVNITDTGQPRTRFLEGSGAIPQASPIGHCGPNEPQSEYPAARRPSIDNNCCDRKNRSVAVMRFDDGMTMTQLLFIRNIIIISRLSVACLLRTKGNIHPFAPGERPASAEESRTAVTPETRRTDCIGSHFECDRVIACYQREATVIRD